MSNITLETLIENLKRNITVARNYAQLRIDVSRWQDGITERMVRRHMRVWRHKGSRLIRRPDYGTHVAAGLCLTGGKSRVILWAGQCGQWQQLAEYPNTVNGYLAVMDIVDAHCDTLANLA